MEEYRKLLIDNFQKHLFQNYKAYCEQHHLVVDLDGFFTYLIDQDIIQKTTIKRYTVLKEFKEDYPNNNFHKTETVNTLADRFNISSRSIWSILKNGKYYDGRANSQPKRN